MRISSGRNIAIVGTGNFAVNLDALCASFQLHTDCFVDEFSHGEFRGAPICRAIQLDAERISGIAKFLIAISNNEHSHNAVDRLLQAGVAREKILPLQDEPALQTLRLLHEQHGEPVVAALLSGSIQTLAEIEARFSQKNWKQVLASLDPERRTVGVAYYGRGGGYRKHISPLIPLLEERFEVVTLSDEAMGQVGEASRHLYMGAESTRGLEELDLTISASDFICGPRDRPRVEFPHVIYNFNPFGGNRVSKIAEFDRYYFYAASRPVFTSFIDLIRKSALKNRVCVIPGGYPKLDKTIEEIAGYRGEQDSILYAPTLSLANFPHGELTNSLWFGPEIVRCLLAGFPDYRVIFRPHPNDLKALQGKRQDPLATKLAHVLELCRENPRCVLDEDSTHYLDSFNRASLMVSDTSSSAFTYAFATGRPVVFFSPHEEELRSKLGVELPFLQDRSAVGHVVQSVMELERQVGASLAREPGASPELGFRDKIMFNLGGAGRYFVDNIDFILNDEKHPDWFYYNG